MSPHLIQSAAKAELDERLRSAERRRVVAEARARRSVPAARPRSSRLGVRSLRVVFG